MEDIMYEILMKRFSLPDQQTGEAHWYMSISFREIKKYEFTDCSKARSLLEQYKNNLLELTESYKQHRETTNNKDCILSQFQLSLKQSNNTTQLSRTLLDGLRVIRRNPYL